MSMPVDLWLPLPSINWFARIKGDSSMITARDLWYYLLVLSIGAVLSFMVAFIIFHTGG